MTRTRFTPWSKAPTLQASSPDIPPDLPHHLLEVYVRIHLGLQGWPHHGLIPAEQLKHLGEHQSQQVLHILEKQVSTTYGMKQISWWMQERVMLHVKIKAKGIAAMITVVLLPQARSWSPVLPPCLLKLTSSDITHHIHLQTENCVGNKPSFPGFPDNSSAIWATDTF